MERRIDVRLILQFPRGKKILTHEFTFHRRNVVPRGVDGDACPSIRPRSIQLVLTTRLAVIPGTAVNPCFADFRAPVRAEFCSVLIRDRVFAMPTQVRKNRETNRNADDDRAVTVTPRVCTLAVS